MVSKFNLSVFVSSHKACPINFFFWSVEWLRLLALYDYSICIMMSRTCCCYNLFPLFSPLCLTQHITQWLFEKILVMDNFSFSLLSRCSISLPFCLVDVLFSERFVDLLVSSTLADPQVCSSQQCGISPWCWKQPRGFSSAVAAKADCRILTCSSRQWSEKVSCPVLFILTKRDKRHWNKEWLPWRWYTFFFCVRDQNVAFLATYWELQRHAKKILSYPWPSVSPSVKRGKCQKILTTTVTYILDNVYKVLNIMLISCLLLYPYLLLLPAWHVVL